MRGLTLVLAALAAAIVVPAAWSRPVATTIHVYSPFNGAGIAAGVRVARAASGYCWTTSSADVRSDAYRCFVGNFIHDPCFADGSAHSRFVLCPISSPASPVLRIDLTKKLPRNSANANPKRYPPWAVQLASGRWCTIFTGATSLIAGKPIRYGCAPGGILLGSPRRGTSAWSIFYARSARSRSLTSISIRSAWW